LTRKEKESKFNDMALLEKGIFIKATTGLPVVQPERRTCPLGTPTFSEKVAQTKKQIINFVNPPKPEKFPPEEW
jgi:hypothetical protein